MNVERIARIRLLCCRMPILVWLVAAASIAPFPVAGQCETNQPDQPIVPSGRTLLFNGRDLDGLYTFLEDSKYGDPRKVFTVRDGTLVISGDGYGGIATRKSYANYRLVCDFRWGVRTWHDRRERARDSGILVHGSGADDAFQRRWPSSFEAQIIEGGLGDLLVLNANQRSPHATLSSKITRSSDGECTWNKNGSKQTFTSGRVNWFGRDDRWEDRLGFRGSNDVDSRDSWTRMEVICNADLIRVLVDGVMVNEATDVSPNSGRILLQCECAEIFIKRWELWPLDP